MITGFGRVGAAFASEFFGVQPDMITMAKGLTNGTVPMSAIAVSSEIFKTFMEGPAGIELFHGYTYSAHPLACAAALATLDVYAEEGLFARTGEMAPIFEDAVHSLKGQRHVIDLRNIGLVGAPGARAFDVYLECFERGLMVRQTCDIIALCPPLIVSEAQIDELITTLGDAIRATE